MLKKLTKYMFVLLSAFVLVGCTASHDVDLEINIDNDMKGDFTIAFYISASDLDDPYTVDTVEESIVTLLNDSGRFTNPLDITKSKTGLGIDYKETFEDLAGLESIMKRISGKEVMLKYEKEDSGFKTTERITGFPEDDEFYFDWIYDAIEKDMLFGEDSGELRDLATLYSSVYWDEDYVFAPTLERETEITLSEFKIHTTVYDDFQTSHTVTLELADDTLNETYLKYIQEELKKEFPKRARAQMEEGTIVVNLDRFDWDSYDVYDALNGLELSTYYYSIEDELEYKSDERKQEYLKNMPKGDYSKMFEYSYWQDSGYYEFTRDADVEFSLSFEGQNVLVIRDIDSEIITLDSSDGVYLVNGDEYLYSFILGDKPTFLSKIMDNIFYILGGIVVIATAIFLFFMIKKRSKTRDDNNNDNDNNTPPTSDSNDSESAVNLTDNTNIASSESTQQAPLEETTTEEIEVVETVIDDTEEIIIEETVEVSESLEQENTDDTIVEVDDESIQVESEKPLKLRIKYNTKTWFAKLLHALKNPETYLLFIIQIFVMFGLSTLVYILISKVSMQSLDSMLGGAMGTTSVNYGFKTLLMQLPIMLGFGIKADLMGLSMTIDLILLVGFLLVFGGGLLLSRLILKLITHKKTDVFSSYAVSMLIIICGIVMAITPGINLEGSRVKPMLSAILFKSLPMIVLTSWILIGKTSDFLQRTIVKFMLLFICFIPFLILIMTQLDSNLGIGYFATALNLFFIFLGLSPIGIVSLNASTAFLGQTGLESMSLSLLTFMGSVAGIFVFIYFILVLYLAFMDIRIAYKRYGNGNKYGFSALYAAILSLTFFLLSKVSTFSMNLIFININIKPQPISLLLMFIINFIIAVAVLVMFSTERNREPSGLTKFTNNIIQKIQSFLFRNNTNA